MLGIEEPIWGFLGLLIIPVVIILLGNMRA